MLPAGAVAALLNVLTMIVSVALTLLAAQGVLRFLPIAAVARNNAIFHAKSAPAVLGGTSKLYRCAKGTPDELI
jgi:hypothetical protein